MRDIFEVIYVSASQAHFVKKNPRDLEPLRSISPRELYT